MRCIGLAQGFKKIGIESVFVIRDYEQQITELIHNNAYDVKTIPKDSSFAEDASLTSRFAHRYCANVIITDISNIKTLKNIEEYQRYLEALKKCGKYLVTIDGFSKDCISNKLVIPSDIIIMPYYGAKNKKYKVNGKAKFLLGTSFFIFREEFAEAANVKRKIMKRVNNVLVSMGGADPLNYTLKVANVLVKLSRPHLSFKIVVGTSFASTAKGEIANVLENSKCNYEIIGRTDNMAKLMLWADLAIISSGLTVYEAAVTQTPSIVLSQYDYHEEIMDSFSQAGTFLHLGYGANINEKLIVEAVEKLSSDFALRNRMSQNGKKLVDGKGVERIISSIPTELMT